MSYVDYIDYVYTHPNEKIVLNPETKQQMLFFNQIDCCANVNTDNTACTGFCLGVSQDRTKIEQNTCELKDQQFFVEKPITDTTFSIKSVSEDKCLRADLKLEDCNGSKIQQFSKLRDPNTPDWFQFKNYTGNCLAMTFSGQNACDSTFTPQTYVARYSGNTDAEGNYTVSYHNPVNLCVPCQPQNCGQVMSNYCERMLNLNDPRCFMWLRSQPDQEQILKQVCTKMYNQPGFHETCKSLPNISGLIGDAARCINGVTGGIHCSKVKANVCANTVLVNELVSIVGKEKADTFCGVPSSGNTIQTIIDFIKTHLMIIGIGAGVLIILIILILVLRK